MTRNPLHFQTGQSLQAFLEQYCTEEQCQTALYRYPWPNGLAYPECGNTTCCQLAQGLHQCHGCHHQASRITGTTFHDIHLPLDTWFLPIYQLTQRTNTITDTYHAPRYLAEFE